MIKHIITTECNRKCTYCITKNLKVKQFVNSFSLAKMYHALSLTDDSLMLTGGEPTLSSNFTECVFLGYGYFKNLYLTTQNPKIFSMPEIISFRAISFSIHDLKNIPEINVNIPIYACVLDCLYKPGLVDELKNLGYSGLTINEEQRQGESFKQELPESTEEFSIKINKKGRCLGDIILLPNLTITNDFTKFL